MMYKHICANCGQPASDEVARGELSMGPGPAVAWRSAPVRLTSTQRAIVQALACSHVALGRSYLASLIDYDGGAPQNVINVHIHNIRQKMPGVPIVTHHRKGLLWRD